MHGGHQECYRNYYAGLSMVPLPPITKSDSSTRAGFLRELEREGERARGRAASRSESVRHVGDSDIPDEAPSPSLTNTESKAGSADTRERERGLVCASSRTLLGRPCAAGCGHYCWATNDKFFAN